MNDVLNYIFKNMNKLDINQAKLILACNRYRKSIRFLEKTTAYLCISAVICELILYKHSVDITILNRKIEELEARLDECTERNNEEV